jgi:8-oxo-dGTP pyrophosphatase MutT (NUDIX family)
MEHIHWGPLVEPRPNLKFLYTSGYVRRAGIIPYMVYNGVTYMLLGKSNEKTPMWADLGGRSESDENTLETALREFGEESRYVLPVDLTKTSKVLITGRSESSDPDQVHLVIEVDPTYYNIYINDKFQQTVPKTQYEDEMIYLRWISYDEFMTMEGLTSSMIEVRNLLKTI